MKDSTLGTYEIDYDGDIRINYKGKEYTINALITVDYEAEIDFEYDQNEMGNYYSFDVENINICDCSSKELTLIDDDERELIITDQAEIQKILNTKEMFEKLAGWVPDSDVKLSDCEVDNKIEAYKDYKYEC